MLNIGQRDARVTGPQLTAFTLGSLPQTYASTFSICPVSAFYLIPPATPKVGVEIVASAATPVVFVVDDDISVRESLDELVRSAGWRCETFGSAQEFLERPPVAAPSCLVLDVSLPGLNGFELQQQVATERSEMPIIFITGHGDIPMSVRAMKGGAVEFLTKPVRNDVVVTALRGALDRSSTSLRNAAELRLLRKSYDSLSRREREVMALVVDGMMNKEVGGKLGISGITVKAHRGRVMQKMHASSLAALVTMATKLRITQPAGRQLPKQSPR